MVVNQSSYPSSYILSAILDANILHCIYRGLIFIHLTKAILPRVRLCVGFVTISSLASLTFLSLVVPDILPIRFSLIDSSHSMAMILNLRDQIEVCSLYRDVFAKILSMSHISVTT